MKYSIYILFLGMSMFISCKRSQLAHLKNSLSPVDWNAHFRSAGDTLILSLPTKTLSWEIMESIGVSKPSAAALTTTSHYELISGDLTLPFTVQWDGDNFGPTQVTIRGTATKIVPGQNLVLLLQALSGQSPDLQTLQEFHLGTISSQASTLERVEFQVCVAGQLSPIARIELKLPRKDGTVRGYRLRLSGV